jgi:hypothetical protein
MAVSGRPMQLTKGTDHHGRQSNRRTYRSLPEAFVLFPRNESALKLIPMREVIRA